MARPRNVVVAQSGGPSPVINNSIRGVVETCFAMPGRFGRVYAAWHGIEGVLKEDLLDLSAQPREEIALLRTTPAAGAIGTCRYKLKDSQAEDFERVVEVLKAHEVGYFFYTGGNDSMDTAHKIARLAADRGLDLVATGVPKTIDNDVGDSEFRLIDHTPGYGSVARYWALAVQTANEENLGSSPADPVLVMQAMGRKIGFIPAAAAWPTRPANCPCTSTWPRPASRSSNSPTRSATNSAAKAGASSSSARASAWAASASAATPSATSSSPPPARPWRRSSSTFSMRRDCPSAAPPAPTSPAPTSATT